MMESDAIADIELDRLTTLAMRAFEPHSSVLRYREADKWHTCDKMGMREAVKAVLYARARCFACGATPYTDCQRHPSRPCGREYLDGMRARLPEPTPC